eukprot:COSAG01_NODE_1079_length_11822_cov_4.368762_18_plen_137_part_01
MSNTSDLYKRVLECPHKRLGLGGESAPPARALAMPRWRGRLAEARGVRQATGSAPWARRTSRRRWRVASAASRRWVFTVSPPRARALAMPRWRGRLAEARGVRQTTRSATRARRTSRRRWRVASAASRRCGLTVSPP